MNVKTISHVMIVPLMVEMVVPAVASRNPWSVHSLNVPVVVIYLKMIVTNVQCSKK